MTNFLKEPPQNLNDTNAQAAYLARQKNFDLLRGEADLGAVIGEAAGGAKEKGSVNAENFYIDGKQVLISATQAQMEQGTEDVGTTPANQHFHPGHPKIWGRILSDGSLSGAGYNVASSSQLATGHYRVVFDISLTTSVYAVILSPIRTTFIVANAISTSAGQFEYKTYDSSGSAADSSVCFVIFDELVDE